MQDSTAMQDKAAASLSDPASDPPMNVSAAAAVFLPFVGLEAATPASQRLSVLKSGDTFIVNDLYGDIGGSASVGSDGLFVNDTRVMSLLRLTFGGRAPLLLSGSVSSDNTAFTAHLTNHTLPQPDGAAAPEGVVHIQRQRVISGTVLHEAIALTNYGSRDLSVPISIAFAGDFRDVFELRGTKRSKHGEVHTPRVGKRCVTLCYVGLDHAQREVEVRFEPAPQRLSADRADFLVHLPAAACVSIHLSVATIVHVPAGEVLPGFAEDGTDEMAVVETGRNALRASLLQAHRIMRERRHSAARVRSNNPLFNAWLDRSIADLGLLTTDLATGPYPYAGIPWFSTPFGRDAVITSLQTLWLQPALARGVLRYLAAHQADEESAFRDAAIGKIMHETRKSEMARTGEVPYARYYGGVDTTPLFIVLAGSYAGRTGDMGLIVELWPALERAAQWVAHVCDRNRYGLLDYQRGAQSGLSNQGWKDSDDSVFHADGRIPEGPIALVEVQAYACAAFDTMANFAALRGMPDAASRYAMRAATIRERVESHYWMPEENFYGMALDGRGELCRVMTSNAGHLLAFGLPSHERGLAVARHLESTQFHTGWGVRTLAAGQPRFNPMSYHNGSVWPHDTALCARGLARYGDKSAAVRLLEALFEAAVDFDMRLPELFCGFTRRRGEPPTAYPVACLPQAWAAGSPFMVLEACLGITFQAATHEIHIDRPDLPNGIDWLEITNVSIGERNAAIRFQRVSGHVVPSVEHDGVRVVVTL